MIGKNNYYLKNTKEGTKVESYSIKKFKVGAASVVIGASIFFGAGAVAQASESVSNNTATDKSLGIDNKLEVAPKAQAKPVAENTRESAAAAVASKLENSEKETLNKTALTKLIEEIDGKFTNGKYASKTEDSVKQLKAALEEARTVLNNAKTQAELSQAHAKLVTATTKLKTKPKDEKQPPADDTTNGKPTVGLQATNTEKSSDSNSIANSGARDKRHGKALNRSNLFRADAGTTDTDTAANQTYTAPAENADLKTLATTLINLDATVENNTKLSNEMNRLGDSKQVAKGTVKEIKEFGGWTAVDGGVFAIARRTEEGVYPLETINSTLNDTVWLREQAFDRDTEYTLLLSKTRTRANRNEATADGSAYKPKYEGKYVAKNIATYKGIEKIFKAYSTKEGSDVIIKFKPGYVGDMDGTKANYKVEVYSITGNQETKVYETTFDPSRSANNDKMIVTPATDGTNKEKIRISNADNSLPNGDDTNVQRTGFIGKREAEKLMARPENLPNGKAGTFTSKPIALPQGADHYKVRISLADQNRTGMSYQAWDEKYSIPVTGADFSIAQDTSRVAKSLLQRVYDKLLATVDADKRGKTPESQKAYQDKLDAIKALLDGELKSTDDYKRLVQPTLEAHKELKVDKSALVTSKNDLGILVVADPTPGKTPETVKVYNDALNAAKAEVDKANTVIGNDSATVDQVAQAVADVKAAKAELKAAEAKLVVAATTEQKTKLQNDSDALTEAVKTGKTPKSIKAYEDKYRELEPLLTAAKAQAKAVLDKTENAGKVEATYAQIEVDKIKAELEKAAALLKDKGNTTELEKAKNDLKTLTQETNVTTGKTKETSDKYEAAKTAAEAAVTAAEAVIGDINSTTEDVANALAEIKVKKAELEAAKKNLVPAATDAQKAKLEKTVAKLVEASTEGKTQDSINAYNEKIRELTEELNQAKAAADKIKTDGVNATKLAALEAQEAVNAVLEKLEAAKEALVEKATDEQKTALEAAEAALIPIAENTLDGVKTPNSINEYKQAVAAIQTDLTQAKAKAAELVEKAKANNATKADATLALAKVEELKAKLAEAKGLLKDKANTTELTNAKEALKALAATENVTAGKTKETADKYDAAKAQADQAVTDAETLIANPNATLEQVATALANVNTKKAALEKAKEALVEKATDEQKTALEGAEAALTPIAENTLDGVKTPNSINEYKQAVAAIQTDLTQAKAKAAELVEKAKANNATKADATVALAKVEELKAKLAEAKGLLKDKANTTELTNAKEALKALAATENVTAGKTKETADKYDAAKAEADQAVTDAETLIANPNATPEQVATALANVNTKKAALEKAKEALVEKATDEQKTALEGAEAALTPIAENTLDGVKTPNSINEYKQAVGAIQTDLTQAKAKAAELVEKAKANNATKADATVALAKVEELKAKLEAAKGLLKDKANTTELTNAKEALKALAATENVTAGKTKETADKYDAAKAQADQAVTDAETLIANPNATPEQVAAALANINTKKAALEKAKEALVEKATDEQKTALEGAEAALTPIAENTLDGVKTPNSINEYKQAVAAIQTDLTQAKAKAAELVEKAKANNATKADATLALAKVEELKAKLEAAKGLLKDKANTTELTNAKEALKALAATENVTAGKTKETADKYDAAKAQADQAVTDAETLIANPNATPEQVATALANVNTKKAALEAAKTALLDKITQDQKDDLSNAEESLKLADTTGKTKDSIKVYNDEVAKLNDELAAAKQAAKDLLDKGDNAGELEAYRVQAKINKLKSKLAEAAKLLKDIDKSAAKKEVEDAAKKATDAIVANNDLTPEQKEAAKAKVAEEATKAIDAIDKATTEDAVTTATDVGKLGIEKEAAKAEIEAAKAAKEKAIEANAELTPEQKAAAKAKVAEEATKATDAIDKATTKDGVTTATDAGKLGIEKEAAKAEIEAAKAAKEKAIEANADLTPEQKAAAKAKVAEEATKATDAIDKATTKDGVTTATDAGKLGIEKEAAKAEIEAAKAAKEKAIEANDKLSDSEKQAAKEEAAKAADEAKKAIDVATDNAGVDVAKTTGTSAVEAVNPVGKEKALAAIKKALAAKEKAIEADEKLSDAEKKSAKEAAKKAADEAKKAINAAADQAAVDAKQTEGIKAVSEVNPVGKDKAKAEIEKSLSEKTNAIDANSDLTDDKKADAKAKIAEEAKKAIDAIDKATTTEDVAAAKESGKLAIEKEAEKAEIEAAKAAKEKAIDARTDLTDDEKAKAKAKVAEEAKKAIEAIENAKTHNDASEKTETGKDDIKKINPIGGKEIAKKAIDEALAAKEKAIDARTDLLPKEKEAAKKAAREEAEAAKNAIDKATTSEDINKGLEDGKENIAKINPIGAKEEAKKAVEEALANKEKEIDESTNLTPEEKVKAKALAHEEAKVAKDAIDKATSIEAIEKALRPFLYQIDQDALVFDLPTFDFEEALKSLVQGTVSIELGSDISDQDILSKLDLPEGLEVVKIEKPTTTILGATSAKVTIKLSDGSYATVEVPVEVVKNNSKGSEDNRRPEDKVRVDKTTENTNREENRSNVSKENSKVSKNMLPNTGTTETNTGLAGLGLGILGGLLAARRRKEK